MTKLQDVNVYVYHDMHADEYVVRLATPKLDMALCACQGKDEALVVCAIVESLKSACGVTWLVTEEHCETIPVKVEVKDIEQWRKMRETIDATVLAFEELADW